jgi:hypothetical protein
MSVIRRLLVRLKSYRSRAQRQSLPNPHASQYEEVVQAHGAWLALLATILERERVITGDELARALAEYAAVTAADRPAEGRILAFWASRLQDTAASLRDFPTVH